MSIRRARNLSQCGVISASSRGIHHGRPLVESERCERREEMGSGPAVSALRSNMLPIMHSSRPLMKAQGPISHWARGKWKCGGPQERRACMRACSYMTDHQCRRPQSNNRLIFTKKTLRIFFYILFFVPCSHQQDRSNPHRPLRKQPNPFCSLPANMPFITLSY